MEAPLILCTKTAAARNLLHLLLPIPKQAYLSSDCTTVAGCPFQFKTNPLVVWNCIVLVNKQRPSLVSNNNIQHSAIPQVYQCHCASIVNSGGADCLRNIYALACSVVKPDSFLLITRQATPLHCRPVGSVRNNRRGAA